MAAGVSTSTSRRDEVAAGLSAVRDRIAHACDAAGRDPSEVHLIVVTKTFPAQDVRLLADLGVTDVGENRHQEAVGKHAECDDLDLTWHFVGGLQTNKAAVVAEYADVVHSVDRARLVRALGKAAERTGRPLRCLLQVSLDEGEEPVRGRSGSRRSGAHPRQVSELADQLAAHGLLELAGVMGVAPPEGDTDRAFATLADVSVSVRSRHPGATMVSAGMSGDLEVAVRHGATHVRVGSAVLGERPPNR
jgi:PLP dependent protein